MPANVTDASFDKDVIGADKPVIVDFWAPWCGPCKMIAPMLDEVEKEVAGRVSIAKVNIDDNPESPGKYGVRGIPTLMMFKGGQLVSSKVGVLSKSQFLQWVDQNA